MIAIKHLNLQTIHTVLHDQLVAAAHANSRPPPSSAHLQSSQDQNSNIDPAIAGGPLLAPNPHPAHATLPDPGLGIQSASAADPNASQDSRKSYGKRELSTSKRAAQNRAAQVQPSRFLSFSYFIFGEGGEGDNSRILSVLKLSN